MSVESFDILEDDNTKNSSREWFIDLVNSIANLLAIVNHLTEAVYSAEKDIADSIDGAAKNKEDYLEILLLSLDLRRRQMNLLKSQADYHDRRMWCPLKHGIESYMESMEVWQAEQSDETYANTIDAYNIMLKLLSKFLGRDVTLCGRCDDDAA